MASKRPSKPEPEKWYHGADIPLRVIRDFACRVAERFQPDKIILFGSYAYGTPHTDSDVDILVVMPARNELDQSVRIDLACARCFPLDLLVRTPKNLSWRLEEGDSFLREIVSRARFFMKKKCANNVESVCNQSGYIENHCFLERHHVRASASRTMISNADRRGGAE